MSNDITTMYIRDRNKKTGRKGHFGAFYVDVIKPADYGDYILQSKKRGRKK